MTFDPNKYLSEKLQTDSSDIFDPDKYLSEKQLTSQESDVLPELKGGAAGYLTGTAISGGANLLEKALTSGAEGAALEAAGIMRTPSGQAMNKLLTREQVGVTQKQLARKILDEKLLPGFTKESRMKDLERVLAEKDKRILAKKDFLDQIGHNIKITPDELIDKLETAIDKEVPKHTRVIKEAERKAKEVEEEIKRFKGIPSRFDPGLGNVPIDYSLNDVEDFKVKVGEKYNPDDVATEIRRKAYKKAVEEKIEGRQGYLPGKVLLDKFRELKAKSGESKVLEAGLREMLGGSSSITTAADIVKGGTGGVATKASSAGKAVSRLASPLAKTLDVGSKTLKAISPVTKRLPLGLGVLGALISGDANAAVPILSEAGELGSPRESLEGRFEAGEKLTPQEIQQLKSNPVDIQKQYNNSLKSSSNEQLKAYSDKAISSGKLGASKFFNELSTREPESRSALIYSAMQNPEMKEKIMSILGDVQEE